MTSITKHTLIAILLGALAWIASALIPFVPVAAQPLIAGAVGYFTHYYLENAPQPVSLTGTDPSPPATAGTTILPSTTPAATTTATATKPV